MPENAVGVMNIRRVVVVDDACQLPQRVVGVFLPRPARPCRAARLSGLGVGVGDAAVIRIDLVHEQSGGMIVQPEGGVPRFTVSGG
jgi:hypothetical protein